MREIGNVDWNRKSFLIKSIKIVYASDRSKETAYQHFYLFFHSRWLACLRLLITYVWICIFGCICSKNNIFIQIYWRRENDLKKVFYISQKKDMLSVQIYWCSILIRCDLLVSLIYYLLALNRVWITDGSIRFDSKYILLCSFIFQLGLDVVFIRW
jgi:hypothetical protein